MKKLLLSLSIAVALATGASAYNHIFFIDPTVFVFQEDGTTLWNGFVSIGYFDGTPSATTWQGIGNGFPAPAAPTPFWVTVTNGTIAGNQFTFNDLAGSGFGGLTAAEWDATFANKPIIALFTDNTNLASATRLFAVDTSNKFFNSVAEGLPTPTASQVDSTDGSTAPFIDTIVLANGLSFVGTTPIPEPSTVALIALGLAGAVVLRRRRA